MKPAIRVRVGTRNPMKLSAVELGLAPFFERVTVLPHEAASGVDEQPIGFPEIIQGARNRARKCWPKGNCDFAAGIEDGLVPVPELETGYLNIGCCVIYDGTREGLGFTAGFEYPPDCVEAATAAPRMPIGGAFDALFRSPPGLEDPGTQAGNIGRLTGGRLTRAGYGAQAVTCAVLRFLHPGLYAGSAP